MSKRQIQVVILLFQLTLAHVLAGNATFSGLVLDENNAPVSGLGLELLQNGNGNFSAIAQTDPAGSFTFEAPPGQFNLYIVFSPLNNIYPSSRTFELVDDQMFTNYVFHVHTMSAHTSGFLKDTTGVPIVGVEIVFTSSKESAYLPTRTDSDGFFETQLFPGTWTLTPSVSDLNTRGCIKIAATNFNAIAGDNHLDLIAQRPNLTISGTIKDDEGAILTGIRLTASDPSSYPGNTFRTDEKADGSFALKVSPAWWWLGFELPPDLSSNYQNMAYEVNLTGGQSIVTNLVLPAFRSLLNGTLVNSSGMGISNAMAQITGTFNDSRIWVTAPTDDKGRFSARLPNGDFTLTVSAPNFRAPPAQTIAFHNETRNITLQGSDPTATIVGTVRDDHGSPITNLTVTVQSTSGPPEGSRTQTDSDGHYVLAAFSGTWLVSLDEYNLNARGFILPQSSNLQRLTLADGQIATNDLQVFSAPVEITVSVSDILGNLRGASVSATAIRNGQLFYALSSHFVVPPILRAFPGEWLVSVSLPNTYKPVPSRRVVVGDTSINLQFTAFERDDELNSTLSGQILDESGASVSGFDIRAYGSNTNFVQKTDSAGKFQIALSEGIWTLRSTNTDYVLPDRFVRIAATTNIDRTITIRKITANLAIHFNQPIGPSNEIISVSVDARTRIGFDHFSAYESSEMSSDLTLRLVPGEWTLSSYYILKDGHFYKATNRTVTVPSAGLSIDMDLPLITATIRGKVVDESGAPVPLGNLSVSPVGGTDTVETAPDGSFTAPVTEGRFEVRAMYDQNFFWERFARIFVNVGRGETRDIGSLVLPKPTANFKLKVLGPDGAPLRLDLPRGVTIMRLPQTSLSVETSVYAGEAAVTLVPGQWEVQFGDGDLNRAGFASIHPIRATVPEGGSELVVQVNPLPAKPAPPQFEIFNFGGAPILRLFSESMLGLDVESSTDLKTWNYSPDVIHAEGFIEIPPPDNAAPVLFYRAVQTEQ